MKISYNWLKDYLETDLSPQEMGTILTDTGLEVESVEKFESIQGGLNGVVVAEVLTCEKHPNADKLKVTTVNFGSETVQVVCGAPNVAVGQKVLLATVGSTIYPNPNEPLKIKSAEIRGVLSNGMLCAEDELGLGESHDGILVLDDSTAVGTAAASLFGIETDYVLEIGLTPNRADAMGHIGVARDLKAYLNFHRGLNKKLLFPESNNLKWDDPGIKIELNVENQLACPKYSGLAISNVKIEPSPAWLQNRLKAVGLMPINNVVDITNYVMRELGTPLHAFDLDKIGHRIVVRNAKQDEEIVTLDGVRRKLSTQDLLITNGEQPLCIAGIFGGLDSGVGSETRTIFIESAYFESTHIRKSAKFHGLSTDASFRFERGVDPELTLFALKRAASLILEMTGGEIASEIMECYPEKIEANQFDFSVSYCNDIIGANLTGQQIQNILLNLDFEVVEKDQDVLDIKPPLYRVDVTRPIDVVEEVLRIYGFNNVALPEKMNASVVAFPKPDLEKIQKLIAENLVGKGYSEVMNNSLSASHWVDSFGNQVLNSENSVQILNPLSNELNVMRQTMIFGMLNCIEHNQNRQSPDLKLFEFGKVYQKIADNYAENQRLIIALTGRKLSESWNSTNETVSFYSIKGLLEGLLMRMGLEGLYKEEKAEHSILEGAVDCFVLKQKIAQIGWISKGLKKGFGIKNDVFIADLDWDALTKALQMAKVQFKELPKTFAIRRDYSLLIDENVSFEDIRNIAVACDKKILKKVHLFDVYEGEKLEKGKKSYAVSFTFQDKDETLKDEQIDAVMNAIRQQLEMKLSAVLR
jgi:phenylalanyl-tRNA synthetase beta chain